MSRYVDIEAFEEELCKETADYRELERRSGSDYSWLWRKKFYEVLKNFPPADVEEVKHGKWIRITQGADPEKYMCPFCHRTVENYGPEPFVYIRYPYCHCGARMEVK